MTWLGHAGLAVAIVQLVWFVVSAAMTHFYRDRTPEELATMQREEPRAYKFLMLSKAAGIDSPQFRQLVGTIIFARLLAGTVAEQATTPAHDASKDGGA